MVWDLYVDESGSFAEDKHCLVGGFIVPESTINRDLVIKWKEEICAIPEISDMMADLKWKYDHCMRNTYKSSKRKTRLRGELQYLITKEYKKRLQAINGKFVIFDNSTGIYNTDNTTNFLTVLAKGLMMLFYEWPEPNPSIRLHFASRKNITYSNESDLLPVSPTRIQDGSGDQPVIQASQYIAQIRNLAFLQSGQQLLENETFSSMLDNIDIVQDDIVIGEDNEEIRLPNPLTVPSDYICNTFIKADSYDTDYQSRIRQLYSLPNVLIYRTDRPLIHAPGEMKNIDSDENYGKILLRLISYNFREPETSRFFRAFNKATIGTQKSSLNYVIDSLRERVESQETMEQLAERLGNAISASDQISNDQIRLGFIANILLYQESLYTHLGRQDLVLATRNSFKNVIERIEDDSIVDPLLDLADNRMLVNLTDTFDYDKATFEFESIEQYWTSKIKKRQDRPGVHIDAPKYPVYGRTIGSYLQVLRHEIHQAEAEDKELYYSEAVDRMKNARFHSIEPNDISRYYQNACDIEAEMSNFQLAFSHLYNGAIIWKEQRVDCENEIHISTSKSDEILKVSGYGGENYPYILQHYVRILSLMYYKNPVNSEAEEMFKPLQSHINEHYVDGIRSPHPRTQILWKTASFLAFRKATTEKQRLLSSGLFKKAIKELKERDQTVFYAISTGILAEMAWHAKIGNIQEDPLQLINELKETHEIFHQKALSANSIDPFDLEYLRLEPKVIAADPEKLLKTSFIIGY